MALPDGRFFNTTTRQFVTGPEVGAKPVTVEERAQAPRAPRKAKAEAPPLLKQTDGGRRQEYLSELRA